MADFNGVTLPDLPNSYEYNVVYYLASDGIYALSTSSTPVCVDGSETTFVFVKNTTASVFIWADGEGLTDWYPDAVDASIPDGGELFPTSDTEVIWSDHDIMNSDTGEIYYPSSVQKTPMFYYNGVRLPQLPSDVDRSVYPYAIISTTPQNASTKYVLQLCTEKYICVQNMLGDIAGGSNLIYAYNNDSFEYEGVASMALIQLSDRTVLWTDYDIQIFDTTGQPTDEIYLKGTQAYSEDTKVAVTIKTLCDIADSIRKSTGSNALKTPKELSNEIESIVSGNLDFCLLS